MPAFGLRQERLPMPESLAEFFLENYQAHRRERACRQQRGYRTETFTYSEILDMALGFARTLELRDIAKGDRVMVWGENCAEWMAVFFGCVLRGVVVVPMDDGSAADFAIRVFQRVEAKLLVGSRRHLLECSTAGPSMAGLSLEDLKDTVDRRPALFEKADVARDDILQIVFTSGTTAEPKGVVITHGNVLANIAPLEREMRGYLKYERLVHPLRFLNLLPLSHVFGQMLGVFIPPLLAGTVVFIDSLRPSEFIETIRRERVSVVVAVPRFIESLQREVERQEEREGRLEQFRRKFALAEKHHFLRRWWQFRGIRS